MYYMMSILCMQNTAHSALGNALSPDHCYLQAAGPRAAAARRAAALLLARGQVTSNQQKYLHSEKIFGPRPQVSLPQAGQDRDRGGGAILLPSEDGDPGGIEYWAVIGR